MKEIVNSVFDNLYNKNYDKIDNISVCFITDVYTKYAEKTCRFIEVVGDKILDVYKTPIYLPVLGFRYTVGIYVVKYQGEQVKERMEAIFKNCSCLMRELLPGKIYKVESEELYIEL